MAAPPPYDKAQEGDQWLWWNNALKLPPLFAAGGFQPPPPPTQGMGHMQAPQTFGQHITMFYRDPVTTVCPNCRASVSRNNRTTDHHWPYWHMASPDHDLGGCRDRDRGLDICRHSVRHRPLPVCPHPPVPGQHEGTGEYLVYSLTLMSIIFQDAIHRCPNCNAVVGRYKAKFWIL